MRYYLIPPNKRYHALKTYIREQRRISTLKSQAAVHLEQTKSEASREVAETLGPTISVESGKPAISSLADGLEPPLEPVKVTPEFDPERDYWQKFFAPKSIVFFKQFPEKSRLYPKYKLNWYQQIDLMEHYQLSRRLAIKMAVPYLGVTFAVIIAALVRYTEMTELVHPWEPIWWSIVFGSSVILSLGALVYGELYRKAINASFEGLRFNVTKGVFKRSYGSMTFRSYDVIDLYQDAIDYFLGIYQFQIIGSNLPTRYYTYLPGLAREEAFDLYRFVTRELKNQVGYQE